MVAEMGEKWSPFSKPRPYGPGSLLLGHSAFSGPLLVGHLHGLKKIQKRCGLALILMVAMAVGRIRQQHPERMGVYSPAAPRRWRAPRWSHPPLFPTLDESGLGVPQKESCCTEKRNQPPEKVFESPKNGAIRHRVFPNMRKTGH